MEIVYSEKQLIDYLSRFAEVTDGHPIFIDQFLEDAFEFDVDAVSDGKTVHIGAVMQHIEEAGIHSGDSACVLPPYKITSSALEQIKIITEQLALKLNVIGLINIQFAYKEGKVYTLEVNPRASRTIPFVSKATNVPLARIAAQISVGATLDQFQLKPWDKNPYVAVKEAVLPFNKFPNESIFLGPEMKSTGEVMGISKNLGESFMKACISAGNILPRNGKVFISVNDMDKFNIISVARDFVELGFKLIGTEKTANVLKKNGLPIQYIFKVGEGRPNIVDEIKNKKINLVINTPMGSRSRYDENAIGKACIRHGILIVTTLSGANAVLRGIRSSSTSIKVRSLQQYHS